MSGLLLDPHNQFSLERHLTRLARECLTAQRDGYAREESVVRSDRSALARLGPIRNERNPARLVHEAHQVIIDSVGQRRTRRDLIVLATTVLSELLVAWPLRAKHWSQFIVVHGGRVPDDVKIETLHVDTAATNASGTRYTLVVPKRRLKNALTNALITKSPDPVVRWALHPRLNHALDTYLAARRHLVPRGDSFFGVAHVGLTQRLREWQERHLEPVLGFPACWAFHPYRSLVVVSLMQDTRIADPIGVASATLIDSRQMTASVYGHLRPEEHNSVASTAIYSPEDASGLVTDAIYGGRR